MKYKKMFLTGAVISVVLFVIVTLLSYHDGMAYDGERVWGFPFTFSTEGVGMSIETHQMGRFHEFSLSNLLWDIVFAFIAGFVSLYIFKVFRRKK